MAKFHSMGREGGAHAMAGRSTQDSVVEHRRAKLAANLDDHVGWHIVAARRGADGIRVRRLVEAVRLSPVGADEREDPLHALLRVDAIDAFDPLLGEADLSAKFRSIM